MVQCDGEVYLLRQMLPFIFDIRSGSEFRSVVLVVSICVSLMVEEVESQVGTVPPELLASLLEAALVECRENLIHQYSPWDGCLLVHGTC